MGLLGPKLDEDLDMNQGLVGYGWRQATYPRNPPLYKRKKSLPTLYSKPSAKTTHEALIESKIDWQITFLFLHLRFQVRFAVQEFFVFSAGESKDTSHHQIGKQTLTNLMGRWSSTTTKNMVYYNFLQFPELMEKSLH